MKKYILGTAILGGVALFGYAIYRYIMIQADLLKNFSYQIIDFGIQQADLQKVKGTLSVLFKSDADVEVIVTSFIVKFYLNNIYVGYIEDVNEFVIPARSKSVIPFSYTLNPQLVLSDIISIVNQDIQTSDETFEVDGFATLKSGFITLSLPINYKTTLNEIMSGK